MGSNLVVAVDVTQAPNDKQQVEPMLAELGAMQKNVGPCATLLADTGYYSAGNVEAREKAGIEPIIAMDASRIIRRCPNVWKPSPNQEPAPENPAPKSLMVVEANARRLKMPGGAKPMRFANKRRSRCLGSSKSVMGFRQFSLRGLDNVRGEWNLVTMSWNIRRLFTLKTA